MAVIVEAFTIIVRNSTLDAKYPGGRDAFAADCPNKTYCTDGTLSRIALMHSEDARAFIAKLESNGLTSIADGNAIDLALVDARHGLQARGCEWLVFATFKGVPVAWMDGGSPAPIVGPPGYELGRTTQFMTADEARRRLVYLRTQDGVDVYRDKETGKERYVGRAPSP